MTDLELKFLPENLPWISSLSCPVRSRRRVLLFGNTKSARLRLNNIPAKSGPGDEARGGHSCTIRINTIGCRFGRAASLGDRRPHLSSHLCPQRCSPIMCRPVSRNPDRKIDHDNGGQSWRKAGVNANIFKSTFRRPRRPAIESFLTRCHRLSFT